MDTLNNFLSGLAGTAGQVGAAVQSFKPAKAPKTAAPVAAAPTTNWQKFILPGAILIGALLLLPMLFRRG
jgi:hypothetical protein